MYIPLNCNVHSVKIDLIIELQIQDSSLECGVRGQTLRECLGSASGVITHWHSDLYKGQP